LEDPGQPQGPIFEQALRLVWYVLEINGSTNQNELQRWLVSLRENPRQYKSIFGFTKGHNGGLRASVGKTGGYHIEIGQKTIQKAKAHPAEGDRQ